MQTQWSQGYKIAVIAVLALAAGLLLVPFVFPLALGGVLSVVVYPIYKKLLAKKLNKVLSSFVTMTMFMLLILVPTGFLVYNGAAVTVKFFSKTMQNEDWQKNFNTTQEKNLQHIQSIADTVSEKTGMEIPPAQELFDKAITGTSGFVVSFFSHFLTQVPDFSISLFIALLTIFFALIYSDKIKKFILEKSFLKKDNALLLCKYIINCSRGVILSSVVTGAIQAFCLATAAHFTHLGNFFVVGFATFILSFVPVVGSIPVTVLLMAYGIFTDHVGAAIAILIVGSIAGICDNIIRPLLLSGAVEVHPLLSLLAIMGGVFWMGLPGLIIGPLVLTIAISCIPIYYKDYKEARVR